MTCDIQDILVSHFFATAYSSFLQLRARAFYQIDLLGVSSSASAYAVGFLRAGPKHSVRELRFCEAPMQLTRLLKSDMTVQLLILSLRSWQVPGTVPGQDVGSLE